MTALLLAAPVVHARTHGTGGTELASAFDKDDPWDFHVSLGYSRRLKRGSVVRQLVGRDITQANVENVKELRYSQTTHKLNVRAEFGVFWDLQLHIEFPIILSDNRVLSFAQNGGSSCGTPASTNCVTPRNSTTVRDGFVNGGAMAPDQIAVAGSQGAPGGRVLPIRSGLDQINFGLTWAVLNQKRDDTKPTWVIGFEARLAAGSTMRYDPANPQANTAVGRGLHQMHWWTAVAKRFPYIDAWIGFHYLMPIERDDSLFHETDFPGSGQERHEPRHIGWLEAGLEVIPWEDKKQQHKFTIEIGGRLEGIFEGRGYSPIWELLAGQPNLARTCLDSSIWNNGTYCKAAGDVIPYPGITRIENHLNFFGSLALNLQVTKYFQARLMFAIGHEQDHDITFADAGRAICNPSNPSSRGCQGELDVNDPVQVNPMYRPLVDTNGRRYRVAEATVFDIAFSLKALF
ncbi:MAG: hypothetical protein KC503_26570 [Myxococcales bacterium]|nr:hypothetical protein [Myxococcales bacterium]